VQTCAAFPSEYANGIINLNRVELIILPQSSPELALSESGIDHDAASVSFACTERRLRAKKNTRDYFSKHRAARQATEKCGPLHIRE
jgi:hypothetical protein